MPKSIDKNDVDISELFEWSKKYDLEYRGKKFEIYDRLIGDAELSRARVFALRKSAEMRRKLRNEDSDERLALIPVFESTTQEEIINGLLLSLTREYTTEAYREIKIDLPIEPDSEAPLEAREKYQEAVDNFPAERSKKIQEYVLKKLDDRRKELDKSKKEDLYKELVDILINQICETEMVNSFREMCAYFGTYKDSAYNKRLFSSYEEFNNLPSDIKNKFIELYFSLDLDIENLKKLQEVMQ